MLSIQNKTSKKFNLQSLVKATGLSKMNTAQQNEMKGGNSNNSPYFVH